MSGQSTWETASTSKRAERDALLPKDYLISPIPDTRTNVMSLPTDSGLLSGRELEITELDAPELLKRIAQRTYTAVEVTIAFNKRAAIAQQAVNCLTSIMFDSALEQAKALDAHLEKTGKVVGPLHGLPISLKDQIQVKGTDCSLGIVAWLDGPSKEDAVITKILRDAGAVFHVKTNVPTTLMRGETFNYIYGRTTNPHNRNLTAGGSSGGEGALHALRGALVGVGSDIGGSVRIPAACNGTYALRPTMRRVPYRGSRNFCTGSESIESVLGPMGTSLEGITTLFKAIVDGKPHELDPTSVAMPWRQEHFELKHLDSGKKLRFGVLRVDGVFHPLPPVQRGLEDTVKALKKAGHDVIEFESAAHIYPAIVDLALKFYASCSREEWETITAQTHEPLPPMTLDATKEDDMSAYQVMLANRQRDDLRAEHLALWRAAKIDALVAPVLSSPSFCHDTFGLPSYTVLFSGLDLPCVTLPVGTVDQKLDKPTDPPAQFFSAADEKHWTAYRVEDFQDAPIAVQVVGRRFQEEELLGIAGIVDRAVKA